jgi:crossover junction endodeoxyribonuclease RuvC
MGKRYVGIDPSTKTGLVILDAVGNVLHAEEVIAQKISEPKRFMDLAEKVCFSIHANDKVVIEGFSYGSRGAGVSTQYGIGWAIRMRLVEYEYMAITNGYTEVTPSALKKFATGKGNTKKENMILPIYQKWGFESDSDNIRDAYVLAQIGRALDGLYELTKYQEEVLKKIRG